MRIASEYLGNNYFVECRVVTLDQEGTYNYKGLDIKVERIWK